MAASFGRRYIELASALPVSDWSGLGNLAQADLGEDLRRSMALTYTLAMRFVDSSNNLSLSAAERNCLTAQVRELEGELNETNAKLSEVQTKLSNLSSKRKEIRAKTKRLEGKVTRLERELREAKDTAAASQQRVTLLEAEVEALRAYLQSAQERCASLEAGKYYFSFEKERELGVAHSEIKSLRATETLKDKAVEENEVEKMDEKVSVTENLLEHKIVALQEDKKALECHTKSKESALLEAERILQSALERALIVEEVQNQKFELRRQIEICQEEKRTLERELAKAKVSANCIATVVANEWKDENDKVMPVKQWLEERRLM
ncbi:microtubule-associated protein 70-5-like [Humulus lupulus]|uniref:microtubule-associated protein 70-5-like n=1 Tax=Humulus lupulus TaxID=3486 RepID=UPI002B412DEF|nr:microtubule-associated protein 70-5-like [Humulus lupulus]